MLIKRSAPGSSVIDGKIYVMGGNTSQGVTTSVEVYDPVTENWNWANTDSMLVSRAGMAANTVNEKIYVFGGSTLEGGVGYPGGKTVEEYDPSCNITSIEDPFKEQNQPAKFILYQNYPNPFNSITSIQFSLQKSDHVTLKVYNSLGKEVKTMVNEKKVAGVHSVNYNACDLAKGVYFYRLCIGNMVETRKMIIMN